MIDLPFMHPYCEGGMKPRSSCFILLSTIFSINLEIHGKRDMGQNSPGVDFGTGIITALLRILGKPCLDQNWNASVKYPRMILQRHRLSMCP